MKSIEELILDNKTEKLSLEAEIKIGCIKQSLAESKLLSTESKESK